MSDTPLHDRSPRRPDSFQRQRLLSTLGARLLRVADGEVDIELPWSEAIQVAAATTGSYTPGR